MAVRLTKVLYNPSSGMVEAWGEVDGKPVGHAVLRSYLESLGSRALQRGYLVGCLQAAVLPDVIEDLTPIFGAG